jgi:hypothetical protein
MFRVGGFLVRQQWCEVPPRGSASAPDRWNASHRGFPFNRASGAAARRLVETGQSELLERGQIALAVRSSVDNSAGDDFANRGEHVVSSEAVNGVIVCRAEDFQGIRIKDVARVVSANELQELTHGTLLVGCLQAGALLVSQPPTPGQSRGR